MEILKTLKQVNEELAVKNKKLQEIFEEAGPDIDMSKVKSLEGDNAAKVEAIKAMNKEILLIFLCQFLINSLSL